MTYFENEFLPEINYKEIEEYEDNNSSEVIVDSECPCCGYITIPNKGDAISYICPVCKFCRVPKECEQLSTHATK